MTEAVVVGTRAQSVVQRGYVYVVALVAIHMVVLGVANILRVFAEIALDAPSGGFTGLPFLFAEFSRPRELYREQASLAIALLAVGTPVWWWHLRLARRHARDAAERASSLRSLYVHLVIFVTALLVFGYGQRALRLVLQGMTFGSVESPAFFGLEPEWPARAAGAGAMAITAAAALAFHLRLSIADRRATTIDGRPANIRHLALYALVVVGLFFATFSAATTLDGMWRRVADEVAPLTGLYQAPEPMPTKAAEPPEGRRGTDVTPRPEPTRPPGAPEMPFAPSRDDFLRFQLLGAVPAIVAGLAMWLGSWMPLTRGLARGPDVEVERRGSIRKLAIYLVVLVSAVTALVAASLGLTSIGRRLLGDALVDPYNSLWHELGTPVSFFVVFASVWLFHREVVEGEAARETESERAATVRRLYTYLISALGLALAAIGVAGVIGVAGSAVMGMNTHTNDETARYVSFVLVGAAAWIFHWRAAVARLDDDERRSQPRRLYLYASVLGGMLALLVFGSAALYRLLNATLAFEFNLETWHDVWHFVVDSGVAGVVAWRNFGVLRRDRATLGAAADEMYDVVVRVRAADRAAAHERVRRAVASDADVTVK